MRFDKPALTFEQQADLLLGRGLVADKQVLIDRLKVVNYYRLSAYLHPFRVKDNRFKEGTSLDFIWRLYTFDRQLRILTMDAIERVEVSVRTQLAYHFSHFFGPFAYVDPANLPGLKPDVQKKWFDELRAEVERSTEPFILHFREKHGDIHSMPPLWMLVEIMSFGKTLTLFRGVDAKTRKQISALYGGSDEVFLSWLTALNGIRNICAHHGRLWNRELGYQPKIPRRQKHPDWHVPVEITRERIFGILTILRFLLRVAAPSSKWEARLRSLLAEYSDVPKHSMGFPDHWEESLLWRSRVSST